MNVPALKGIHYAVESGVLAAEAIARRAPSRRGDRPRRRAGRRTTTRSRQSFVWKDLKHVRNMRQAFAKGFWRGSARAGDDDGDAAATCLGRR